MTGVIRAQGSRIIDQRHGTSVRNSVKTAFQ